MRILITAAVLLLAACSAGDGDDISADIATGPLGAGVWTDGERDGLCVGEDGAAALIAYAESGANCMAEGTVERGEGGMALVPRGDENCRIPFTVDRESVRFGAMPDACTYYCGGDATLNGKSFRRSAASDRSLEDVAGDPLC